MVALDSFKVEAGEAHQAPALRLIEGGFILGRVINEATGEPIKPGATSDVTIQGPSRPRSGAAVQSSRVREDGSFRIRVAPGRNYIYLRGGENWGRLQVATTPPSRWFEVAAGQAVEVEFKIRKYSQAELQGLIKRGKVKFTFPRTIDEAEADHEFRRMSRLASAIALYVGKHDQTLPKTLSELRSYVPNEDDLNWALEHVELVPQVELAQPGANHRPIAYDATLLTNRSVGYAVFGDFSVRRMRIHTPEQMGPQYGSRPVAAPVDRWKVLQTAMKMYARDHDRKLPDTLDALKPYVAGERYVEWIADNVEYLSPGGHLDVMQNWAPIACQKEQFANDQFTMVLFADGRTESMYPSRIKSLMAQDVPLDTDRLKR